MLTHIIGQDLFCWTNMKKEIQTSRKQVLFQDKAKWINVVHLVGIVLLALMLTRFTIYNISSLSIFAPLDKEIDFKMSDIYNAVVDSKAIHELSQEVVIVGIDGCSRKQTLDVINKVASCGPRAIGLDVYFPYPEEDNTYLISTISQAPNLVNAGYAVQDVDGVHYNWQEGLSFYEKEIHSAHIGYINLNVNDVQHVVRTFRPFVLSANNDTLFSMAYALSNLVAPDKVQTLLARQEEEVIIDYTSYDFLVITASELDACPEEWLQNKVVLIGDAQHLSDAYLTPLHGMKAGVMIHAYELQTILSCNYIETTAVGFNWLIAILLCVLYVSLLLFSKFKMINYGSLVLRIGQFAVIYLLIYLGCTVYQSSHIYTDFAPGVLMIGLGSLAFDLWFGAYALVLIIIKKIQKK